MPVGLSPNTGPPIKFKSVAYILHLPQPVNIIWIDKRCQLWRPISLTICGLSPSQSTAKSLRLN